MKKLKDSEILQIYKIWNQVYPACVCWEAIDGLQKFIAARENPYHFLIQHNNQIRGWICVFDREGARWFTILVDSDFHGTGLGTILLDHCKGRESELIGWMVPENKYVKKNGAIYQSPWGFYKKNGFLKTDVWLKSDDIQTQKIIWRK